MSNPESSEEKDPALPDADSSEDDEETKDDDEKVDEAGMESFPASDPPAF